jgi:hypothetical protein
MNEGESTWHNWACTMIPQALHVNGLEAESNNTYKLLRLSTSGHSASQ